MSKRGGFRFPTTDNPNFMEVRRGITINDTDPDYLFYNAQIINNSTSTVSKSYDPEIEYQDTRTVPILKDKSKYALSVENFTINGAGKNLPIFIPQIREYNSDGSKNINPNNTVYDVTFTAQYGGTKSNPDFVYQSTRSVQWVPELKASWTEQPLSLGQYAYPQEELPYYYCYTYSHWVKLVNTALSLAWADVCSAGLGGGVPGLTIVINSLSGTTVTLDNVNGTFVQGALITKINSGNQATAKIDLLSPFVISVLSGTFNPGDQISQDPLTPDQIPNVEYAEANIVTTVPSTFTVGGTVEDVETHATGTVISYVTGTNTLILYNLSGTFNPGDIIFQDVPVMNTGSAKITTTSFAETVVVPAITFGTKCPFYTYDSKTNLFSLWQDANTCVTPYGLSVSEGPFSPSNPPNPLNVFGPSTAPGYTLGEYSFIGYNTNFESLFTNFNSTYYSDQVPYPSAGEIGGIITSPMGTESVDQVTAINLDSASISGFSENTMTVSWIGTPYPLSGANWKFGIPLMTETYVTRTYTTGQSQSIMIHDTVASYIKTGIIITLTATNGLSATFLIGETYRRLSTNALYEMWSTTLSTSTGSPVTGDYWTLTLTPVQSTTNITPISGVPVSLITNVDPGQSVIQQNHAVTVTGIDGREFNGLVSSYTETLEYTNASSGTGNENVSYINSTLANGFNPIVTFVGQDGDFVINNVIKGQSSSATGQVIEVTDGNPGQPNVITILNQNGPFNIGDTVTAGSGTAVVTEISGPNTSNSIVRTGIISVTPTYTTGGNTSYSGPFNVGDNIEIHGTSNNAVITAISGDNGYTTLEYQQLKNPFTIGALIECYTSLANTSGTPICAGHITAISGDNKGYGTMNFTDQNCKFGVGETIVDNTTGAVATIVQIQGDNNGYGYINYINQLLTGALGNFVPGEFLLLNGIAFAKVIVDNQSVANATEGNIGIVTCITGEEVGGVFYATSNVILPSTGQQIQGSLSGTLADYGGTAYKDTGVLILNNICGTFYVGELIVDSIGFGLKSSALTSQATAICNGMAYLGSGTLTLKNTTGTSGAVATFPSSSFIVDFASSGTTNPLVVEVSGIPAGDQFYQGITVTSNGNAGTVIANNGPIPYGNTNQSTQSLTILPSSGNWDSNLVGHTLSDSTVGTFFNTIPGTQNFGLFSPGDRVSAYDPTNTAQVEEVNPGSYSKYTSTLKVNVLTGSFTPVSIINANSTMQMFASGLVYYTAGNFETNYAVDCPKYGQEVYNWNKNVTTTCLYSSALLDYAFDGEALYSVDDIVEGSNSHVQGIVTFKTNTPANQIKIRTINGILLAGERILNLTTGTSSSAVITDYPVPPSNEYSFAELQLAQCEPAVVFNINDSIGTLPYKQYDNTGNATIIASGANITLTSTTNIAGFEVGEAFYVYNGSTNVNAFGFIISMESNILNIAFTTSNKEGGGTAGFARGSACGIHPTQTGTIDHIGSINYYTTGVITSYSIDSDYHSYFVINSITNSSTTSGTIQSVQSSPTSAFIQTYTPPASTTALTVTNINGTFASNVLIKDVQTTNYGNVGTFNETTDHSGTLTTLNVKNVYNYGSFIPGNIITDSNTHTANIGTSTFQNGNLILKPINGTFTANEIIRDLGSSASATYISTAYQTITGETSTATAIVLIDSGTQLKLGTITGAFEYDETILSNVGVQAKITGFPIFGVGDTVTNAGGEGAIIVEDTGSSIIIKQIGGSSPFSIGNVITSNGSHATVSLVTNPTLTIVPTNSTGESDSWTIVPQTLTSVSTVTPPDTGPFTTNLTFNESFFDIGDDMAIIESDPVLTVEQLYYPENVVQVDLSAGNCTVQTLQSAFPSVNLGSQYVVLVQDFESTSSLWSPIASIVIGTLKVSVRQEYSGTPITIGTGNLGGNATTGSFQTVLLETPIEVLPQESWRGLLTYTPKVETLSSLGTSRDDLRDLDVQMYWRNRLTNSLTPLTLYNGGSANIRLMFKKIHD